MDLLNPEALQALTADELEVLRVALTSECERRKTLTDIPEQVRQMANTYVELGGTLEDLWSTT